MNMFTLPAGTAINKEAIEQAIKANEENRGDYITAYQYYRGDHPIMARLKSENLKNNKVVTNHARYIVRVNTGYLLAKPVEYQVSEGNIDRVIEEYKKQNIAKLDKELGGDVSIFGRAYEYIYSYFDGTVKEAHSKKINVTNAVVAYDDTLEHEPLFGVMYGSCDLAKGKYFDVTVVDKNTIYKFNEDLELVSSKPHTFGAVPLLEYVNNPDYLGDFPRDIQTLIDAYNILQSDRLNDKEQLVEAILVLYGLDLTEDQLKKIKEYRTLVADKDARAEYLLKQLDEEQLDVLRKVYATDIHKISMTPDLSDENFAGNTSGVAIRFKLVNFEQNIADKEIYFRDGLSKRFKMYNKYLNSVDASVPIVPMHKVEIIMKRNLPQNDLETAQIISMLSDFIDQETLLGQVSFIEDASKAVEYKNKEREEMMNLQAKQFGTNQPLQNKQEEEEEQS